MPIANWNMLSMASVLEGLVFIGVPIIFLSKEEPKVNLVVRFMLVTLQCCGIVLLLFVSKLCMLPTVPLLLMINANEDEVHCRKLQRSCLIRTQKF